MGKILLVDDDRATNFYNQIILKRNKVDHDIKVMENGLKAIEYIRNNSQPDFIFLDINMPVMDGFQFLEAYESWLEGETNNTKIYVMMSVVLSDDKLKKLAHYNYVKVINSKVLTKTEINKILKN
ncbi:response regulator [Algibacter sp. AS12]|uniref:response regulator n=1 Tax=Algibacter sp. AS12 TaxID=3135773 RepID=UPI00398A78F3